jgi:GTP-binding protein
MHGANGEDAIMRVPAGTEIYEEDGETLICDLAETGQRFLLLKGGNGGFGNAHFKSATNQAPRRANPGQPAEEKIVILQLKLIADVGLVGLPNAGKSTLLSRVSKARPKIADYPFTTLVPQLGMVRMDGTDFVVADLPGLIEGAHEGVGLGDRFLGHAERCSVILHLIDGTESRIVEAYRTIRSELAQYGHGLAEKPEVLALNKIDSIPKQAIGRKRKALEEVSGKPVHMLSAVSGEGLDDVMRSVARDVLRGRRKGEDHEPAAPEWAP